MPREREIEVDNGATESPVLEKMDIGLCPEGSATEETLRICAMQNNVMAVREEYLINFMVIVHNMKTLLETKVHGYSRELRRLEKERDSFDAEFEYNLNSWRNFADNKFREKSSKSKGSAQRDADDTRDLSMRDMMDKIQETPGLAKSIVACDKMKQLISLIDVKLQDIRGVIADPENEMANDKLRKKREKEEKLRQAESREGKYREGVAVRAARVAGVKRRRANTVTPPRPLPPSPDVSAGSFHSLPEPALSAVEQDSEDRPDFDGPDHTAPLHANTPGATPFTSLRYVVLNAIDNLIFYSLGRENLLTYVYSLLVKYMDAPKAFLEGFQNLILVGNPGSGKTEYANRLAQVFSALNIVCNVDTHEGSAVVREKVPTDFIGQYIGQTAPRTRALLLESTEKVLFIDEAYGITENEKKGEEYGQEAVNELVGYLSTHIGQLIVIAAGYEEEMMRFQVNNVGLARRMKYVIKLSAIEPAVAANKLVMMIRKLDPSLQVDSHVVNAFAEVYGSTISRYYKDNRVAATGGDASVNADQLVDRNALALKALGNGYGSLQMLAERVYEVMVVVNHNAAHPQKNVTLCHIMCAMRVVNALSDRSVDDDEFVQVLREEIKASDLDCSETCFTTHEMQASRVVIPVIRHDRLPDPTRALTSSMQTRSKLVSLAKRPLTSVRTRKKPRTPRKTPVKKKIPRKLPLKTRRKRRITPRKNR